MSKDFCTRVQGAVARGVPRVRGAIVAASLAAVWMVTASAQAPAPAVAPGTVFEVKPGDTFGRIAAQVTGNPAQWRQVYHPQKSGLPNPNLILVGSQFELDSFVDQTRRAMGLVK